MPTLTKQQAYCKDICNAWCCKHIVFEKEVFTQDDKLFYALRGMMVDPDNGKLILPNRCRWINNHNMCVMYERRPESCKVFQCDKLKDFFPFDNHEKKEDVGASA
jgi:hypothetical protein